MKKLKFYLFTSCLFLLCFFSSCGEPEEVNCATEARFQDFSGTSGCGILITVNLLDEWRILNPINLNDFNITPIVDLELCIEFIDRADLANSCEIAEVVELISISVK